VVSPDAHFIKKEQQFGNLIGPVRRCICIATVADSYDLFNLAGMKIVESSPKRFLIVVYVGN
jgi:hypothetical protein